MASSRSGSGIGHARGSELLWTKTRLWFASLIFLSACLSLGCAGTTGRSPRTVTVHSFLASLDHDPCVRRYFQHFVTARMPRPEAFKPVRGTRLNEGDFRRSLVGPGFESERRTAVLSYASAFDSLAALPGDLPNHLDFGLSANNPMDTELILSGRMGSTTELDTLILGAPSGRWSLMVPCEGRKEISPTLLLSPYWILLRDESTGERHRLDLLFSRSFFPSLSDGAERSLANLVFWRSEETVFVPYVREESKISGGTTYLDLLEFCFSDSSVTYFEGPEIQVQGALDTPGIDRSRLADCLISRER